ncbi:importin-13 [Thecamonas trahens ATCC 50062]|uniref:Importin-13 n=1 Tax=Thecamonas trahens ATCC 50062 TaxID=461836 RepID=A0A0L0DL37_THETB|nr:importin-13 [Thecamonas trahens ATCC 50062]KNC52975.1 importin-13 [Thecamonas trahens ATCC 50062]|eukprot:XP_013754865.1 importin-13 [Thecamonas trahens ATCC 50062]
MQNYMRALEVLSTSEVAEEQQAAQEYMLACQASADGWSLAVELLQLGDEVWGFLGAKMLASKIVNEWLGLEPDARAQLQGMLFQLIRKFDAGPLNVLTRLCIAFAGLLLRELDGFEGVVVYLIGELDDTPTSLVQILTILPEEFQRANVRKAVRSKLRHELLSAAPQRKVLYCLHAWIEYDLPHELVLHSAMLQHAFAALTMPELFAVAVDVVELVLSLPLAKAFRAELSGMASAVANLRDQVLAAHQSGEWEHVKGVGRLAAALCDSELPWLLECELKTAGVLYDILMVCVATPKRSALELSIQAWSDLAHELVKLESDPGRRLSSAAPAALQAFVPVFAQLLEHAFSRARLSLDWERLDSFDTHYWQLVRRDCAELFESCAELLGPVEYFTGALAYLRARIADAQHDTTNTTWREVETALFAIRVASDYLPVDPGEDEYEDVTRTATSGSLRRLSLASQAEAAKMALENSAFSRGRSASEPGLLPSGPGATGGFSAPSYLAAVLNEFGALPSHVRVAKSAIKLVGAFAGRFGGLAPTAMALILPGFDEPGLCTTTASCLRELCSSSADNLVPILGNMVSSLTRAMDKLPLRPQLLALEALGYVIAKAEPGEALGALEVLALPLIEALEAELEHGNVEAAHVLTSLTATLSLLTAACRFVDIRSAVPGRSTPLLCVVERAWPAIEAVATVAHRDEELVVALTQFCGNVLRASSKAFAPHLDVMLSLMTSTYIVQPAAPLLNVIETAVAIHKSTDALRAVLPGTIDGVVTQTLAHFSASDSAISAAPDLVYGFFSLLTAVLRHEPAAVVASDSLNHLFLTGMRALSSQEKTAISSVLRFFDMFFSQEVGGATAAVANAAMQDAFASYGEPLVRFAIEAFAGGLPRSLDTKVADFLFAISFRFPYEVNSLLQQLFGSAADYPQDKFLKALMAARVRGRFRRAVKDFSLQWRGLSNTPYGASLHGSGLLGM